MPIADATMNDDERIKRDEATVLARVLAQARRVRRPRCRSPRTCSPSITAPSTAPRRRYVRVALMAALAYFIDPFDIIPDVLPIIGLTDDAAVLAGAIKLVWDADQARAPRRRPRRARADGEGGEGLRVRSGRDKHEQMPIGIAHIGPTGEKRQTVEPDWLNGRSPPSKMSRVDLGSSTAATSSMTPGC